MTLSRSLPGIRAWIFQIRNGWKSRHYSELLIRIAAELLKTSDKVGLPVMIPTSIEQEILKGNNRR